MSSNKLLFVLFFIVVTGLIGGIIYMYTNPQKSPQAQLQPITQQHITQVAQITTQPTQTAGQSDISNQQLDKDSQSIDNNLNSLDSELTNIDQGLNDQQTSIQ